MYSNRITAAEYREMVGKKSKKNKYNAKKTKIDGITFDSKKEADRYCELKLLQRAGEIRGFCMQPKFLLRAETKEDKKETYSADFIIFHNDGTYEIEDTKGFETEVFKLKKKMFKDKFPGLNLIVRK